MEVLLDGPAEETLDTDGRNLGGVLSPTRPWSRVHAHLAALAGNAAVMVTGGLVATHHTWLILFEVAGYVPWERGRGGGVTNMGRLSTIGTTVTQKGVEGCGGMWGL